jgi:hypothetical protein
MKKISFVLALFTLLIGLMGCQGQAAGLGKVTIYPLNNGTNNIVLEDKEIIKKIEEAISGAEKVPGIVNIADPEYRIELEDKDYFLWINGRSGTIMDNEDTNTIHSLSKSSIKLFNNLISVSNQN